MFHSRYMKLLITRLKLEDAILILFSFYTALFGSVCALFINQKHFK